jgi:epoxyqueuosine reductase
MNALTKKVKNLASTYNIDFVGIAAAESLNNEAVYHRPQDFLPTAKTVISLGVKLALGTQLINRRAHREHRDLIYAHLWHGFGLPSMHYCDRAALFITRMLEAEGNIAVPVMSASTYDVRTSLTEFLYHHAAVAAGLGELGWDDMVVTPEVGSRLRLTAIITDAKLDISPMYSGPKLCDVEKCKKSNKGVPVCTSYCPTQAISTETKKVIIGDKTYTVAKTDQMRCAWGSMGLNKKAAGLKDIAMPKGEITPDDIFNGLKQRDPKQVAELMVINRGDYCGRCLMECPVGKDERVEKILNASGKNKK